LNWQQTVWRSGAVSKSSSLINRWKAQIGRYPSTPAEAIIKKHLTFFPVWGLGYHFRTLDDTIWRHQILVETAHNLVAVLAALNHLYFTTFQFKRMAYFIAQMEIAPANLAVRLEALFHQEMPRAVAELEMLVAETVALVEK
jgi:hypothetical protein